MVQNIEGSIFFLLKRVARRVAGGPSAINFIKKEKQAASLNSAKKLNGRALNNAYSQLEIYFSSSGSWGERPRIFAWRRYVADVFATLLYRKLGRKNANVD